MIKGIIKFSFQKIIDENSTSLWDKYVFDDTWMEYKIQAANYNQQSKARLFTDIIKQNAAAQKLHYSVSVAAVGYIRQLQGVIPGLLNAHGKIVVPFKNFKFNIIESDITNGKLHRIEIIFISEPIICIDFFNNHYLIAAADKQQELNEGKEVETEMIPHSNQLSIYSIIKAAV
jgi:hypothetical protein